jgi:hypothetical protein
MLTLEEIVEMIDASGDGYEELTHIYGGLSFCEQCDAIEVVGSSAGLKALKNDRAERNLALCGMFEHLKVERPSLLRLIDRLTDDLCETSGGEEHLDKLCADALAMLEIIRLIDKAETTCSRIDPDLMGAQWRRRIIGLR